MTGADALDLGREHFRRHAWSDAATPRSRQPTRRRRSTSPTGDARTRRTPHGPRRGRHRRTRTCSPRAAVPGRHRAGSVLRLLERHGTHPSRRDGAGGRLVRRAARLDEGRDCIVQGYLLVPAALTHLISGDGRGARQFAEATVIADRFGDPDLARWPGSAGASRSSPAGPPRRAGAAGRGHGRA